MIKHYYFNNQLRKYIIGFANIFTGLKVQTGKDDSGKTMMIDVPIRYGSTDRVTAAIAARNTQNNLHTLPMMACYMKSLELAPDRLHGVNTVDRKKYLEQGGIYPDDVKVVTRVMPIPYNMQMELAIYASNTDQMFQILEQILILFDYDLQVQFNDANFDWTKISKLTLVSMSNEENYPVGTDIRSIVWTLDFDLPVWISPPAEIRKDLVNQISVRIGDIENLTLNEIDKDGNLTPFDSKSTFTEFTVKSPTPSKVENDPLPDGTITSPGGMQSTGSKSKIQIENQHYDASLDLSCTKAEVSWKKE